MARKLKLFVVFALLALVPLRALAAVTTGLCATAEGGTAGEVVAQHQHHHHSAASDEASPADDTKSSSLVCSLCTACCTGASFASHVPHMIRVVAANLERIPFFGRDPATGIPARLDRPPLSL